MDEFAVQIRILLLIIAAVITVNPSSGLSHDHFVALAYLNDDTQPSDIAPCSHFSASSLVSHYDQSFAPCVFMMHGSSFTKTNGRDAGVGATAQRGKLENDDLSDTSPPALAYLYQRTGTGQFTARH